jgi:hypothetical protein
MKIKINGFGNKVSWNTAVFFEIKHMPCFYMTKYWNKYNLHLLIHLLFSKDADSPSLFLWRMNDDKKYLETRFCGEHLDQRDMHYTDIIHAISFV